MSKKKFVQEVSDCNEYKTNNLVAIITDSKSNKKSILKLIKTLNPEEYKKNGLNDNKKFIIPIIVKKSKYYSNNIVISDIQDKEYGYSNNFHLDTKLLKNICDIFNIPICFKTLDI